MSMNSEYQPSQKWLQLGEGHADPVAPAQFPKHELRYRNQKWAEKLGMGELGESQWIDHFGKFEPLPENLPNPLALRYHGHQFTHYNPDLGDGRGFLFAQLEHKGRLLDLGTKGSGQTPWSRSGDGRLTLKGAVREALATAFLEKLNVNTSKTFSVIETGESLERNDEPSPTRSAVLVRLSHSHIRIGTFQRLAHFEEKQKMRDLLDYCLTHHYPDTKPEDFFNEVCRKIATTTAQWMVHGFVHGVLNTDNINITGESFDYGPYRFLPHYDPKFTAAYFDHQGLYAFGNQPTMVFWNLERLKEALQLIETSDDFYTRGFKTFKKEFNHQLQVQFAKKLGLKPKQEGQDLQNLFYSSLQFLEKSKAPFQAFHHHLYCWHQNLDRPLRAYGDASYDSADLEEIEAQLAQFERDPEAEEKSVKVYPDLLIDEIESIWNSIAEKDDWSPFENKLLSFNSISSL